MTEQARAALVAAHRNAASALTPRPGVVRLVAHRGVWRTADGGVVLHHDLTGDRTTDRPWLQIEQATAAQLEGVSAGRWKSDRWASEGVPPLTEAALVPPGRALVVEIVQGPQVVPDVRRRERAS